jgi:hypothetical protein
MAIRVENEGFQKWDKRSILILISDYRNLSTPKTNMRLFVWQITEVYSDYKNLCWRLAVVI